MNWPDWVIKLCVMLDGKQPSGFFDVYRDIGFLMMILMFTLLLVSMIFGRLGTSKYPDGDEQLGEILALSFIPVFTVLLWPVLIPWGVWVLFCTIRDWWRYKHPK